MKNGKKFTGAYGGKGGGRASVRNRDVAKSKAAGAAKDKAAKIKKDAAHKAKLDGASAHMKKQSALQRMANMTKKAKDKNNSGKKFLDSVKKYQNKKN